MEKRTNAITLGGNPMTLVGAAVEVGQKAVDFTVVDKDLKPVKLSDFDGQVKLISVVPSIDTGVCDAQTRRFNEEAANLSGVAILTISVDLPFALGRFCGAAGIDAVSTLSDHKDTDFGVKYGFLIEELRLLARGIVVVDKDNTIRHVEYVSEVTNHPDYEAAIAAVKELV